MPTSTFPAVKPFKSNSYPLVLPSVLFERAFLAVADGLIQADQVPAVVSRKDKTSVMSTTSLLPSKLSAHPRFAALPVTQLEVEVESAKFVSDPVFPDPEKSVALV